MKKRFQYFVSLLVLLSGCATIRNSESAYFIRMKRQVLDVVQCSNPEILLSLGSENHDGESLFREIGHLSFDFSKIMLGPNLTGYRADYAPRAAHQVWFDAWLFELRQGKLVPIYEHHGSYLSTSEDEGDAIVNGRYKLLHFADNPPTEKIKALIWSGNRYVYEDT